MKKPIVFLASVVPACSAFVFAFATFLFLMKQPRLDSGSLLELSVVAVLFLAASSAAGQVWQRRKSALWSWLIVCVFAIPYLTAVVVHLTTATNGDAAIEQQNEQQDRAHSFLPTRAEMERSQREQRLIYVGLVGLFLGQAGLLYVLRRRQVLM